MFQEYHSKDVFDLEKMQADWVNRHCEVRYDRLLRFMEDLKQNFGVIAGNTLVSY